MAARLQAAWSARVALHCGLLDQQRGSSLSVRAPHLHSSRCQLGALLRGNQPPLQTRRRASVSCAADKRVRLGLEVIGITRTKETTDEEARRALEAALGDTTDKFKKWDEEIQKREATKAGGGGGGGRGRGWGGGDGGAEGGEGKGGNWVDEAKQILYAIGGIVLIYLLLTQGMSILAFLVNSILFVLRGFKGPRGISKTPAPTSCYGIYFLLGLKMHKAKFMDAWRLSSDSGTLGDASCRNRLGREYCNPGYCIIVGNSLALYKSDPNQDTSGGLQKPLLAGPIGKNVQTEEVGKHHVRGQILFTFSIKNSSRPEQGHLFGVDSPEKVERWLAAVRHARDMEWLSFASEIEEQRTTLLKLEQQEDGSRALHRRGSVGRGIPRSFSTLLDDNLERGAAALDSMHQNWRLTGIENGLRIFAEKNEMHETRASMRVQKAIGIIEESPEIVFRVIMDLGAVREQWDPTFGRGKLVEEVDGHIDIIHFEVAKYIYPRSMKPPDYCLKRYWRRDQDGGYSIMFHSVEHPSCPPQQDYIRGDIKILSWEVIPLPATANGRSRSLVENLFGADHEDHRRLREHCAARHVPATSTMLASRVDGVPVESTTPLKQETVQVEDLKNPCAPILSAEGDPLAIDMEEFFDAQDGESTRDEPDEQGVTKGRRVSMRGLSLGLLTFKSLRENAVRAAIEQREVDSSTPRILFSEHDFKGSLPMAENASSRDCWARPPVGLFYIRGPTYMHDRRKVQGGEPLLTLMAVDWFATKGRLDHVAARPGCLMQREGPKKAPFILVCNLQVPGKPNYSMVFYFASDRTLRPGSLLQRFVDGDDIFRNARFKLIPSIAQGAWVVKRAVGTKACLLGQAVSCRYHRHLNYLEIDVDIGSSSVARGVIGLVIGYVEALVVDLAIVIEGRSQVELPEVLLAAMRVCNVRTASAEELHDA
eukprot:SM000079S22507  [mRNA]  locus=s79:502680:515398:- [translate_table: standard]